MDKHTAAGVGGDGCDFHIGGKRIVRVRFQLRQINVLHDAVPVVCAVGGYGHFPRGFAVHALRRAVRTAQAAADVPGIVPITAPLLKAAVPQQVQRRHAQIAHRGNVVLRLIRIARMRDVGAGRGAENLPAVHVVGADQPPEVVKLLGRGNLRTGINIILRAGAGDHGGVVLGIVVSDRLRIISAGIRFDFRDLHCIFLCFCSIQLVGVFDLDIVIGAVYNFIEQAVCVVVIIKLFPVDRYDLCQFPAFVRMLTDAPGGVIGIGYIRATFFIASTL